MVGGNILPSKYITLFYGTGRGFANKLSGNGTFANFGGGRAGAYWGGFSYFDFLFPDLDSNCIYIYLLFSMILVFGLSNEIYEFIIIR